MNLLPGIVTDGGQARLGCGSEVALPDLSRPPRPGDEVVLGIRPEDMDCADPDAQTLTRQIAMIEELGGTRYVDAHGAGGPVLIVEQRGRADRGRTVAVRFRRSDVRVFDPAGPRIR